MGISHLFRAHWGNGSQLVASQGEKKEEEEEEEEEEEKKPQLFSEDFISVWGIEMKTNCRSVLISSLFLRYQWQRDGREGRAWLHQ